MRPQRQQRLQRSVHMPLSQEAIAKALRHNLPPRPSPLLHPERLFSGAKITITDRRNRLGIKSIQAIESLKSWMGILESRQDDIEDEEEDNTQVESLGPANQEL